LKKDSLFLSDAQLKAELERCESCEEKPCRAACPANCSPADFIMMAKVGEDFDIRRSAAEIMTNNPLGGVCGLVCPERHCISGCTRLLFDNPIAIPALQAEIVKRAKERAVLPPLEEVPSNGKKVAIVGAGPAGIAASLMLAQKGYAVDLYEKEKKAGGACNWIPSHRLPREVIESDVQFTLASKNIHFKPGMGITDFGGLLCKDYNALIVAIGLPVPITMGIPNEELALLGTDYLGDPSRHPMKGRVAVIGGGATATDCAVSARRGGASHVEMFVLEKLDEMPLTAKERGELLEHKVDVSTRQRVTAIEKKDGIISGLRTVKVTLPPDVPFNLRDIKEVPHTEGLREDFNQVIVAIGNRSGIKREEKAGIFYAGDCVNGPTTVVEAVASGKNVAAEVDAYLSAAKKPEIEKPLKSHFTIKGYNWHPVPLAADFFGRPIISPFLLSAAPPSDGYLQMKKAYEAGWAGGIMKTAFDNVPIHIPGEYMHAFDGLTYGNCDNVSGHPLERVCQEIRSLVREFPDRLTIASTGGPVTGNDESDRKQWQSNTKKIEEAGAMAIEYSLSCPQGGDGTEGDIVSQNAALTARIIGWIMEVSAPGIPKLFKLTAQVTSIAVIINAIKKVFEKYPEKKAGITLANTFPTLFFRKGGKKEWEEGIVVGMSGRGVTPISNLTLANVSHCGVAVSGNGGPMDYKEAANFLALGAKTVQFCTIVMKYGYHIIDDLHSGLSHLMAARGILSVDKLIGIALPRPVTDFMALSPVKKISSVTSDLCVHCGNCTRCPYLAITLDEQKIPVTDPSRCIGCSICAQKCISGALSMRTRTAEETALLKEE
jgi:NADPH-dependent glutamate synthase beta subunit-like oxidoreductase/dihydroorotate dehydrogenase/Pyruvate/2-oxoacid:ferredoxin oxidoreductase delta subunit